MSLVLSAPYDVPGNFSFDPAKIVVASDARLIGSAPFSTEISSIKLKSKRQVDNLINFAAIEVINPSFTAIRHILIINCQGFWFDSGEWVISDGTFAQSNLTAEINDNLGLLNLSGGVNFRFKSFLQSFDGTQTPSLQAIIVNYNYFIETEEAALNECIITGNLKSFTNDPVGGGTIKAFSERPVFHGSDLIAINTTDDIATDGAFCLSVVETETIDEVVFIELNFQENGSPRQKVFRNVTVPNQATVELSSIVVPS